MEGKILLTWYAQVAGPAPSFPVLQRNVAADVCVVGGGLAGLTTALELTRMGKKTVVLEAETIGFGASGRNGGFVSNGFAEDYDLIVRRVGEEAGRALYDLSRGGTEFVRSEIESGDHTIKMGDGKIVLLRHAKTDAFRRHGEDMGRRVGETYEFLDRDAVRAKVNSVRYHGGLFSPDSFHINPLRYVRLLASRISALGGSIHESSRVVAVERKGATWHVQTGTAHVTAGTVVYCVSSLDRRLHPPSGRAILPVSTYVAVTEPLQQQDIKTNAALLDTRRAGDYYRLVSDGRLLWGGRITTRISRPANLARLMQRDMTKVFPRLDHPRIDFVWPGLMAYAVHKMPVIGHDGQGQWFATGFGGHGLNTTATAGQVVARAIGAGDDSYRRFSAFGPQWAYGPLGRIGVQGSYWYMQVRDRIDERRTG